MNMFGIGKGSAGGAQMNPAQQKAQTRVDNYKSKGWAADDTIDMDLWNKQAGVQGGVGPPAPPQGGQNLMFGQFGDPKKSMGSIWEHLKGAPGKFKEGMQNLDKRLEANYAESGWGGEGYKSPYDKSVEEEKELGYASTGEDIDESKSPLSHKEKVDKVLAAQQPPEGQEFKENMNKYKQEGEYGAGQGMGQAGMLGMGGGMWGGWLNRMLGNQDPWDYEVQSKHKYMKPKG